MKHRRPEDEAVLPGAAFHGAVCARCPKALSASCCEVKPHERLATLTHVDVERVQAALGLAPEAFSEWEWLDADHLKAWLDLHPAYVGYLGHEPRRLGLKAVEGRCALFEPGAGCRLSPRARPTACRLYPFDVSPGLLQVERFGEVARAREAVASGGSACLAVEEAQSEEQLHRAFGVSEAEVARLQAQLRGELAEHARREREQAGRGGRRGRKR